MKTPDLEEDLKNSERIKELVKSDIFAQNLYAAMCNIIWKKDQEEWTCSWRYAGGLVAQLKDQGEGYLDYYCSGIEYKENQGYVTEGTVAAQVAQELGKLGWRWELVRAD